MNPVIKKIKQFKQPVSFADVMQVALYDNELGYYRQNQTIIGEKGDFITAPEISNVFTLALKKYSQRLWQHYLAKSALCSVLEFGAGNGSLAKTWLENTTIKLNHTDHSYEYEILELSRHFKLKQQRLLQNLPQVPQWLNQLSYSSRRICIANEVLDCLPAYVGEISYQNNQWAWQEHVIDFSKVTEHSDVTNSPLLPSEYAIKLSTPKPLPLGITAENCFVGRIIEIPRHLQGWLASVYASMLQGIMIIIDYAQTEEQLARRNPSGTLRSFYRHHLAERPLENLGQQDITYDVHLSHLHAIAEQQGFQVIESISQAELVVQYGLEGINNETLNNKERWQQSQQIQQLTSSNAMGDRFMVTSLLKK